MSLSGVGCVCRRNTLRAESATLSGVVVVSNVGGVARFDLFLECGDSQTTMDLIAGKMAVCTGNAVS